MREILEERDSDKVYRKERFSARPYFGGGNPFRALNYAGRTAIWDFVKAFPKMVVKHLVKPR